MLARPAIDHKYDIMGKPLPMSSSSAAQGSYFAADEFLFCCRLENPLPKVPTEVLCYYIY